MYVGLFGFNHFLTIFVFCILAFSVAFPILNMRFLVELR